MMVVPDVNILVFAYNKRSPFHKDASAWWLEILNQGRPVGLAWVAVLGFIRHATNRHVFAVPMAVPVCLGHVQAWLSRPHVQILSPGDRHEEILFGLLNNLGVAGNLTTDAHLAALAIEYNAELVSADTDFARFPGLRWLNPLSSK